MKIKLATGTIALSALMLTSAALSGAPKPVEHIEVTASRFSFEPHEITVKKGDPVVITMHSSDVTHGLVIEELGVKTTEIKKGESEDLTLTPEATGTFEGRCAHFCGKGHGSMVLTVHVVD